MSHLPSVDISAVSYALRMANLKFPLTPIKVFARTTIKENPKYRNLGNSSYGTPRSFAFGTTHFLRPQLLPNELKFLEI